MQVNAGKDTLDAIEERLPYGRWLTTILIGLAVLAGFVWVVRYLNEALVQPVGQFFAGGQYGPETVTMWFSLGIAVVFAFAFVVLVIWFRRYRRHAELRMNAIWGVTREELKNLNDRTTQAEAVITNLNGQVPTVANRVTQLEQKVPPHPHSDQVQATQALGQTITNVTAKMSERLAKVSSTVDELAKREAETRDLAKLTGKGLVELTDRVTALENPKLPMPRFESEPSPFPLPIGVKDSPSIYEAPKVTDP